MLNLVSDGQCYIIWHSLCCLGIWTLLMSLAYTHGPVSWTNLNKDFVKPCWFHVIYWLVPFYIVIWLARFFHQTSQDLDFSWNSSMHYSVVWYQVEHSRKVKNCSIGVNTYFVTCVNILTLVCQLSVHLSVCNTFYVSLLRQGTHCIHRNTFVYLSLEFKPRGRQNLGIDFTMF